MLSSIAEQERKTIKLRQQEGIAAAKLKGKHLGRKATKFPDEWEELYPLWIGGEITAKEFMKKSKLKKTTFYKLVKVYQSGGIK